MENRRSRGGFVFRILALPGAQNAENLRFVVFIKFLAAAGGADVALSAPLRCGIFPDMVGKSPVYKVNAAAVVLFAVAEGHAPLTQKILNGL